MSFEDLFKQGIPLHEASAFFVGIKKTAEWTDPPDMTGELEGAFLVPVEQVLAKLREIIAMKYRKMIAYNTYAQSFRDHAWGSARDSFSGNAYDEKRDAEFYTKRAVALGGPVHIDPIDPPPASTEPAGILRTLIRAEQEMIFAQRSLLQLVGGENPMRVGIDDALRHDCRHLDEMWQMMPSEESSKLEVGQALAGAATEPGGETGMEGEGEEPMEPPGGPEDEALMAGAGGEPPPPEAAPAEEPPPEEPGGEPPPEEEMEATAAARMKLAARAGPRVRGVYAMGPKQQRALYSNMVSSSGNWSGFGAQPTFGSPMGGMSGMKPKDMALLQSVGAFRKHGSIEDAAVAMRGSLAKMAQEVGEMGGDAQAPMASPTAGETEASNYLAAEMAGRQAQEQNESSFYREQLGAVQQQAQMAQQAAADASMQLQQVQQQAQEAGAQIQAATTAAVAAQDSATQQTLEAAKSRIGAQEMRSKMLELASQDPQMLGEQALAPPPPAPGMEGMLAPPGMGAPPEAGAEAPTAGAPAPPEGPAGGAPEAPPPPGAPPAGPPGAGAPPPMGGPGGAPPGGPPPGPPPGGPVMGGGPPMKMSSALGQRALGAGIGAAVGAGSSAYLGAKQPDMAEKVRQLEGEQTGGFLQAARLAAAKKGLAGAELAQSNPVASAITGGLAGGLTGAVSGPRLIEKARMTAGNVQDAMR